MATRRGPSVLQVYIFRDGEFIGTDVFVEREIVIGRDPDLADLLLEDSSVSREHALVSIQGNKIVIEDLGSTNGVVLNDEEEVEASQVTRLDEVGIGEFTLKFKLGRKGSRRQKPATRDMDDDGDEDDFDDEEEPAARPSRRIQRPAQKPAKSATPARSAKAEKAAKKRAPPKSAPIPKERTEHLDENDFEVEDAPRRAQKAKSDPKAQKAKSDPRAKKGKSEPKPSPREKGDFDSGMTTVDSKSPLAMAAKAMAGESDGVADGKAKPDEKGKKKKKKQKSEPLMTKAPRRQDAFEVVPKDFPAAELAPIRDDDDDDDDDDYQDDYRPPYSLVDRLLDEDEIVAEDKAGAVEIIHSKGEEVRSVALLRPGESFWIGPKIGALRRRKAKDLPPHMRLIKVKRGGACELQFRKGAKGMLRRGRDTVALKGSEKKGRRGILLANIKNGELLDLDDAPFSYHVRYVNPPPKLTSEQQFEHVSPKWRPLAKAYALIKPDPLGARAIGGSLGFHVIVFIALAIMAAGQAETAVSSGEFVEVALNTDDLKLEEPEPDKPEPEKAKVKQEAKPNMEAAPTKKRPKAGGTSSAGAGVLGLLSKRGSSAAPGPAAAVAAVSNLSASRAPGAKGGFRVSSLMGKMPTSRISVGGGGGGPVTKGALALLRGGPGGGGRIAGGKGTRKVGGMVTKVPKAMRSAGQGSLDRDEIQKVINKGISQIQRCYERELLRTPGLSGKIQVEWTISTSGSVRSVRQAFASLNSTSAVSCIMGKIKTWKFPRPKGGEVVVTYPFIFKPVGY